MAAIPEAQRAVIVVAGLPGVGKTTVADIFTDRVGGVHLRSDSIRKELFDEQRYSAPESEATYSALFKRASIALVEGRSVVLDATFDVEIRRDYARHIADRADVPSLFVAVECDPETVKRRIADRNDDASDADFAVYEQKRRNFDPIQRDHRTIDNSGSLDETRSQVEQLISKSVSQPSGP